MYKEEKNSPNRSDRGKPLYFYDMEDDQCVLQWMKAQYKFDREDLSSLYSRFDENLAAFVGKGPSIRSAVQLTDDSYRFLTDSSKNYVRLHVNRLKSIIELLVGRYISNKTNFFVTPRHLDDFKQEVKAKTGKRIIDSVVLDRNFDYKKRIWIQDALIFGEGYIRVFWNTNIGDAKRKKTIKKDWNEDDEDSSDEIEIQNRQGDVDFEILDPRMMTLQNSESFGDAEWALYVDYHFPEKLKVDYPEKADEISPSDDVEDLFNAVSGQFSRYKGMTRRYRLWHRACKYMPEGRYIEATDDCILVNEPMKGDNSIRDQLFPVVQLIDHPCKGSARGRAMSVMEPGKPLQMALHNLWSIYMRNLAKFAPIRAWPAEMDEKALRKGTATDVFFSGRPSVAPQLIYQDPVSPSLVNAINLLDNKLLQLSSITPALQGQGGSNMEVRSGTMLNIFREIDASAMLPMSDRIKDSLEIIGRLILGIAADNYKDNEERLLKLFGKRSRFMKHNFRIQDIQIPMDVKITRGSAFPATQEGKIAQLEQLMSMFPEQPGVKPLLSREQLLDILELGEPEEFFDSVTASIDTADREIGDILEGREVSPPNCQLDLFSYYETYLKAMQHPQIKDEVPLEDDFLIAMASQKFPNKPGFRLLRQVLEIETLLWEKMENNDFVRQTLQVRFPFFPTIFKPEPEYLIDPRQPPQSDMMAPPPQNNQQPIPPMETQ